MSVPLFKKPAFETFPSLPGVYFFKDELGSILYIGKARNLKKRIRSYFGHYPTDWKIKELLTRYKNIEFVITQTEHEALITEAHLISTHKPPFNALLKSDTPFVYLLGYQGTSSELPSLSMTRTPPHASKKHIIFGPFLNRRIAQETYIFLMKNFKLHRCNKTIERGCLEYHLGLCAGSCISTFDPLAYRHRYELALSLLKGEKDDFLKHIEKGLKEAITYRAFESAQEILAYKNNIEGLFTALSAKKHGHYQTEIERVLFQTSLSENQYAQGMKELQNLLQLPMTPQTIDCIDISHFQGHAIVGSCVRFEQASLQPRSFKRYALTTLTQQNDYAAIQEIIKKRYKKEEPDLPDILMIDGGKGQKSAALEIIDSIPLIALAKREERLFTSLHPEGVKLDWHTAFGKMLIALRDCAHRTALHYHKKSFAKKTKNA